MKNINLALTEDESDTLFAILCQVGGSPVHSPRKYASDILNRMRGLGLDKRLYNNSFVGNKGLYFKDNSLKK
jgi:hypothetical protein